MQISLTGINHRTAPIAILEKAAVRAGKLNDALRLLHGYTPHGVILSTCNRTEVYTADSDSRHSDGAGDDFLKAHIDVSEDDLAQYIYVSRNEAAVEHLFHIAGGLDSMIVGEFEILGQVRQALEAAQEAKMANLPLRHIFQGGIRIGRRVREETGISKSALSVSSVAVDMASRVVGDLKKCRVLVVGAGEAGCLVAKAARDRGASQILVASRTEERASTLATTLGGISIDMNNLVQELNTCNIVVTCADAPHWIVAVRHVAAAMEGRSELPMVIIDIAVPRNVEPAVAQIDNVFLYNLENLNQISSTNRRQREKETEKAGKIITAEIAKFAQWRQAFETQPVLSALMKKAEEIRQAQLKRTLKKLRPLSYEERDSLEAMSKSITIKILQEPIERLKEGADNGENYAEMVSELFRLDMEEGV
ncbi:glutamyl-tRNA reductase [Chloroflexota bacterium]